MAQEVCSHTEMAQARQSDGISVIFDKRSPGSSSCRSRSSSSGCRTSRRSRGRDTYKGRHRSSSSSCSSRSTSRSSRSRSHPRCHRHSSRCRCRDHRRYSRGYRHRSPPCHYRAHSRPYSRSPSVDRSTRRYYRSRSRSPSYSRRYSRAGKYRCQFSRSPPRSFRGRSRFRSSERSAALSLEEKRQLLNTAKENAMKMLGVERLELPESVKPIMCEESAQPAGPVTWVRRDSENTASQQSSGVEHDDASSPKLSPKRRMISFSVNNSVAKPTAAAPSSAKVTSLVDSIESRKPYGHWIPVKSVRH